MSRADELFAHYRGRLQIDSALPDCWLWLGYSDIRGYGRVKVKGVTHLAARYFYSECIAPVRSDQYVYHTCHNKGCVNPAHLIADKRGWGQRVWADKEPRPAGIRGGRSKLTPVEVREILQRRANGEKNVVLSCAYGVSEQTISHLLRMQREGKL